MIKGWDSRVAMIGMDGELEYLIKAWKRVLKSFQNTEAVGAVTVVCVTCIIYIRTSIPLTSIDEYKRLNNRL